MVKEKFVITSNDVDRYNNLKISSLFRFFQDVATVHINSLGAGHNDIIKQNLLWVIIRIDVKLYAPITVADEIVVSTHAGENRACLFDRYFQIYNRKGKLIGAASSLWTLIDKDTRKVCMKPNIKVIKPEHDKDDIPVPEKIVGEATNKVDERKARYSEIDLNGHLNNVEYIKYIFDIHPSSFYQDHVVKEISVNYDKEIKEGDVVTLYSEVKDNVEIVKGKLGEQNSFTARIIY